MGILKPITEWATSPWGQNVPIHIAWFLIWIAAIAGLLFLIVHSMYVRYFAKAEEFQGDVSPTLVPFYRRGFLGTHLPRVRFTGSWQPRCSRCSSPLSSLSWVSSSTG